MRVCANENIPEDCVTRLRQSGHDVLWIRETSPGCSDVGVKDRALAEDRLLITFDKDFGELAFRRSGKASLRRRTLAHLGSVFDSCSRTGRGSTDLP